MPKAVSYSKELNEIKRLYGEDFMKFCRAEFATILEQRGKLLVILESVLGSNCRTLSADLEKHRLKNEFKNFIYSRLDIVNKDEPEIEEATIRTPYELLEEVGYDLFECRSEEEIQEFKKYYAKGEELCTFKGGRLNDAIVFFAVKKNVDEIKRENFKHPQREDKYGTSVLGIQFNKKGICTPSILNRYNHTIADQNPDATFGNDLDKIKPGLVASFRFLLRDRGLQLSLANLERIGIPEYTVAGDGRLYKYNMEVNGIYYCPGNIVIKDSVPRVLPKHQVLMDDFVLDKKERTLKPFYERSKDSFADAFTDIESTEDVKEEDGIRRITIRLKNQDEPVVIKLDGSGQIVRLY